MLGPINSELVKINSKKVDKLFYEKCEEINKLYVELDIPVPVDVQLKYPQEVEWCYNQSSKELPEVASSKLKFLKKIGSIKLLIVLLIFGTLITFLLKSEDISVAYQLVVSIVLVFGTLPLFMVILNLFIEDYDKKILKK